MTRPIALTAFAAALALTACQPTEPAPQADASVAASESAAAAASAATAPQGDMTEATSATPTGTDACGAANLRARWVGAEADDAARATLTAAATGDGDIRIYTEGDPITMDFREDRLNVVLGPDGRIKELRCG